MAGEKALEVQEEETYEVFKAKTTAALLKAKLDTEQLQMLIETAEKAKVVSSACSILLWMQKIVIFFYGFVTGRPEESSNQGS